MPACPARGAKVPRLAKISDFTRVGLGTALAMLVYMDRWASAACFGIASVLAAFPAAADPTSDGRVTQPDSRLLKTGALTLGLSYAPAAAVAAASPRPVDRFLYAPVAGPWLNLDQRRCENCKNEGLNKALLIGDGIIQGVGAVEIVASFLFLETTFVTAKKPPLGQQPMRLELTPVRMAGGYGLRATGTF